MDKQFDYYYLQKKTAAQWVTLAEGASVAALTAALTDHLARLGAAQVRIAAATYDAEVRDWRYQQLFYIDRSLIDVPISQAKSPGLEKKTAPPTGVRREAPPLGLNAGRDAGLNAGRDAGQSLGRDEGLGSGQPGPGPGSGHPGQYEGPSLGQAEGRRGESADMDRPEWLLYGQSVEPTRFEDPPAPRRPSWFKFIVAPVLIVAVLVLTAFGGFLYQGHPIAVEWAGKLRLSNYLPSLNEIMMGLPPASQATTDYPVEPATTGQAVKYPGIPVSLLGRWSDSDCNRSFTEFTATGYARTVGGTPATKPALVIETVEDDAHYYLRRSPLVVEHIRKLAPDAIQMVGTSVTDGFQESAGRDKTLSRCR